MAVEGKLVFKVDSSTHIEPSFIGYYYGPVMHQKPPPAEAKVDL